jgi:hypothetical protein
MAILTDPLRYPTNHGGAAFKCPARLPLYDKNIAEDATTVVCICAESAHCAHLDNYASYEAVACGAAKFLHKLVDKVWYNNLKDADTFYTKVLALKIIAFLDANSGGLHAVDMITLCTNMHGYYAQVDGIPQYIIMLEEAQKKGKVGRHAHRRHQARHDGLGDRPCGATFSLQGRRLGRPSH